MKQALPELLLRRFEHQPFRVHGLAFLLLAAGSLLFIMPETIVGRAGATDDRRPAESSRAQKRAPLNYRFVKGGCTDDGVCGAVVFVDAAHFNRADMIRLAKELSHRFTRGKSAGFYLFDDPMAANAYASGNPGINEFMSRSRGHYYRSRNEEYIKFAESPGMPYVRTIITLKAARRRKR
jgi:hypothetical protein